MASELAAMYVSIIPSAKGMQKNIGKELAGVESQAASTGQSMGSKLAGGMAKTLKAGAIGAGLAVGGVLGTAVVKGFGRLQALENAQAKLTGLGHSGEAVTGIMKDALASVKGTAFGMDEAASAAAGAVASGIKPGKDLERVLKLMGDAATIAGTDMGSMGAIFNKVASSNKIQGDVIAQLQDQGIPIVQLMAKELGVTAEQTVKMASDGEISFEIFRKAMENGMGGAALESGKTVSGAFKNMNAALGRFGAALLKDTYPLIGPVFASLTTWIDKGTTAVGPLATSLSKDLFGSLQSIWGIISRRDFTGPIFGLEEDHAFIGYMFTLRDAVTSSFDRVKVAFTDAKNFVRAIWAGFTMDPAVAASYGENLNPVLAFGVKLREAFNKILPAITQLGAPLLSLVLAFSPLRLVFEALLPVLPQLSSMLGDLFVVGTDLAVVVSGALVSAMNTLTPIISDVITNVAGFISGITGTQGGLDLLKGVLVAVAAAWVAYKVGVIAATVVTNAQSIASKAAAAAQWLMNAAMTANPIGIVVVAIAALVAGLVYFFTQTETGRKIIETVWGAIKTFIGGIVTWFKTYVLPTIQAVFSTVGSIFSWLYNNIVKPVFDGIKWYIGVWWTVVSGIFQVVVALVRNTLGPIFTWFYNSVIKPVWEGIKLAISVVWNTYVKPIFNAIVAFVRNTLAPAFEFWKGVVTTVFNAMRDKISGVWNDKIKPVFDSIKTAVGLIPAAFEGAKDGIGKAWDAIKAKVKEPIVAVLKFINEDLIGKFNTIPGVNIKPLPLPPGFRNGGYTGDGPADAFAGHVHKGEYVFTKEQTAALGKERLAQMARSAVRGDMHGLGAPMPGSEPHIWGPPQMAANRAREMKFHALGSFPMSMVSRAAAAWNGLSGVTARALQGIGGGFGANSVSVRHGGMANPNWIGYYSGQEVAIKPGGPNELATLVHEMGHAMGLNHNTGNTSVMHPYLGAGGGALWPTTYDAQNLRRIYGAPGTGVARDPGNGGGAAPMPDSPFDGLIDGLMAKLKEAFPGGGMFIDAAGGLAKAGIEQVTKVVTDIKNGISKIAGDVFGKVRDFFGGGSGQMAPTLYDNGGVLGPGNHLVSNRTRKPEAIFTNEQAKALVSGRGNSEPAVHLHVENMFDSAENIVGELRTEIRRGVTSYNLRQVARVG